MNEIIMMPNITCHYWCLVFYGVSIHDQLLTLFGPYTAIGEHITDFLLSKLADELYL